MATLTEEELGRVRKLMTAQVGRPGTGRPRLPQQISGTPAMRLPAPQVQPTAKQRNYLARYQRWRTGKGDKGSFRVSPYVDAARGARGRPAARPASKWAARHPRLERAIKWGLTPTSRGGPLGSLYLFGGNGPRYDCSGLVQKLYARAGIRLPRVSRDQFRVGRAVSRRNLQRGDLLFWSGTWRPGISHVAIYLGRGLMLEAPSSGKRVRIVPARINARNYAGARRIV